MCAAASPGIGSETVNAISDPFRDEPGFGVGADRNTNLSWILFKRRMGTFSHRCR